MCALNLCILSSFKVHFYPQLIPILPFFPILSGGPISATGISLNCPCFKRVLDQSFIEDPTVIS